MKRVRAIGSVSTRHVRHPDRTEMRRDPRRTETVVKNGLYDRRFIFEVVVDGKREVRDWHAVVAVMLRVDAGVSFKIVHRLRDGTHEMIEDPGTFWGVEILGFDKVEFSKGCKLWGHASEGGAASFKTGLDLGPVVDGDFVGLIERFATGKFLSVPRRRNETDFG